MYLQNNKLCAILILFYLLYNFKNMETDKRLIIVLCVVLSLILFATILSGYVDYHLGVKCIESGKQLVGGNCIDSSFEYNQ